MGPSFPQAGNTCDPEQSFRIPLSQHACIPPTRSTGGNRPRQVRCASVHKDAHESGRVGGTQQGKHSRVTAIGSQSSARQGGTNTVKKHELWGRGLCDGAVDLGMAFLGASPFWGGVI